MKSACVGVLSITGLVVQLSTKHTQLATH